MLEEFYDMVMGFFVFTFHVVLLFGCGLAWSLMAGIVWWAFFEKEKPEEADNG